MGVLVYGKWTDIYDCRVAFKTEKHFACKKKIIGFLPLILFNVSFWQVNAIYPSKSLSQKTIKFNLEYKYNKKKVNNLKSTLSFLAFLDFLILTLLYKEDILEHFCEFADDNWGKSSSEAAVVDIEREVDLVSE